MQRGGVQLGEIDDLLMIGVVAQQEGAGNIIAHGDDLPLRLRAVQKIPGVLGIGGVVQSEYPDDPLFLHGDALSDVQVRHHSTSPFFT